MRTKINILKIARIEIQFSHLFIELVRKWIQNVVFRRHKEYSVIPSSKNIPNVLEHFFSCKISY